MRRRVAAAGAAACLVLLAGCGGAAGDSPGDAVGTEEPTPSPGEDPAHAANPVIDDDFPDPDVLEVDGTYYAYATEGNLRNVRVASSTDLVEWTALDDALPELPAHVIPGRTWAPEVAQIQPGRFVLYYTATNFRPSVQCIGVAVADAPQGPFEPVGDGMLVCPDAEGGAIDASTFVDPADGTPYLLWKNDGNCCGLDTWLQIAPLTPDGTALVGEPVRLVQQDQPWEGDLVEAPTLVERDGTYVLLYSANDYGGENYATGYATASSALGPYTKAEDPLLTTDTFDGRYVGPGGQDVVVGPDGSDLLVFHSWYGGTGYRGMNVLPLTWSDGVPTVTP
ncbi:MULTISPECIES: glycoside hydrolase family 43 protein [unclassified Actinotalea]|uniref:glycoside hydrolase family 43 protein n=1 Tax=unclassified Actinotalea TaxID=2638618 RepID=UPI00210472DF|nr:MULTISPECIES: glycoside hydrolase family 43 protein [unclassified Actinotalea]